MNTIVRGYDDLVFINCPFDKDYLPILQAIVYVIYRCGFHPQTALAADDGSETRLEKIMRFIEHCKFGLHDISRTETNDRQLPRFNMPFELGLFFGAKRYGIHEQKAKNALVFERTKYSYLEYISDLSGIDTKAHNNDPGTAIKNVRDWLSTASKRTEMPGYRTLEKEYMRLRKQLPGIARRMGFDFDNLPLNDFCKIVERWLENTPIPTLNPTP